LGTTPFELFRELKWDDLVALPRENRVSLVKKQAEIKFTGAQEAVETRFGRV
jgi:hypothetical protein